MYFVDFPFSTTIYIPYFECNPDNNIIHVFRLNYSLLMHTCMYKLASLPFAHPVNMSPEHVFTNVHFKILCKEKSGCKSQRKKKKKTLLLLMYIKEPLFPHSTNPRINSSSFCNTSVTLKQLEIWITSNLHLHL